MAPDPETKVASLHRVRVVLVEPKSPGNVGSSARACANAGLGAVDLVGPLAWEDGPAFRGEADRMARHAAPLLDAMRIFPDVAAAVADASFVVGTSVRTTGPQRLATPRAAAAEILERAAAGPVAIMFGREDRGLSIEELLHCDLKVTVPSSHAYPAWNLSHAVAVMAASLREEAEAAAVGAAAMLEPQRPFPDSDLGPATHGSLERLFAQLEEILLEVGYLDPKNPDRIMADLRRILGSRGLQERDVRILMGMVHQLAWAARRRSQV